MSAHLAQQDSSPCSPGTQHYLSIMHSCWAALRFSGSQQHRCIIIRDLGVKQKHVRQPQRCS